MVSVVLLVFISLQARQQTIELVLNNLDDGRRRGPCSEHRDADELGAPGEHHD